MGSLTGLPCVLCGGASTRVGEHVWPAWLISDFYAEGPFEVSKAGVSFTARDSELPLKLNGLPGVHVPMCEACNQTLNTRFEESAKPVVRRLIPLDEQHVWPTLPASEVEFLAFWFLKVGLLSAHPAAVHDLPHVNNDSSFPRLDPFLSEWTAWMRAGAPPPEGFSVFLTRRAVGEDIGLDRQRRQIQLPRIIVDGDDLRFVQRSFGVRGVNVTIVWHPGWRIDNMQVNEGRAVRLWPDPAEINFALLPEVNPQEFQFVDATLAEVSTTHSGFEELARTPLSHQTNALDIVIASMSD